MEGSEYGSLESGGDGGLTGSESPRRLGPPRGEDQCGSKILVESISGSSDALPSDSKRARK